ncbi:MAG: hypothetical protein R2788_08835 [Saprospiraceae bacterium]
MTTTGIYIWPLPGSAIPPTASGPTSTGSSWRKGNLRTTRCPLSTAVSFWGRTAEQGSLPMNAMTVRIWTVARTPAEIQESFLCSGLSGPQTGLLHEFIFDHGTAGGSNTGIDVVENTANVNAPGLLQNFALSGNASNWVEGICGPKGIVYVDANASGNNDGSSWTNAFNNLQDALSLANTSADVTQIWVAAGTYYPDQECGLHPQVTAPILLS